MMTVCGTELVSFVSAQEPDSGNNSNKNHFHTDPSRAA